MVSKRICQFYGAYYLTLLALTSVNQASRKKKFLLLLIKKSVKMKKRRE